jgi:hypothetical protein
VSVKGRVCLVAQVSVDGVPVGLKATFGSVDEVASLLRGPPGDPVGIVVRRGTEVGGGEVRGSEVRGSEVTGK